MKEGRLRILVATVAFGMGIDCPHIRRVIHLSPPSDTEEYICSNGIMYYWYHVCLMTE